LEDGFQKKSCPKAAKQNNNLIITSMEKIIKEYNEKILSGRINPPEGSCVRCGGNPGYYKLHERRRRGFRYIEGCEVKLVDSYLVRWKCPFCGRTFTGYPYWACPFKRYVLLDIENLSANYLERESATYSKVVGEPLKPMWYATRHRIVDGSIEHGSLFASTLWHWVGCLGLLESEVRDALNAISQKDPHSGLFRRLWKLPPILSRRYRSEARRKLLESATRYILVAREYFSLFGRKIFPRFAIRGPWP